MGSLSSGHRDTECEMSGNNQDSSEETEITMNDSRSAFDRRDSGDLSPYN